MMNSGRSASALFTRRVQLRRDDIPTLDLRLRSCQFPTSFGVPTITSNSKLRLVPWHPCPQFPVLSGSVVSFPPMMTSLPRQARSLLRSTSSEPFRPEPSKMRTWISTGSTLMQDMCLSISSNAALFISLSSSLAKTTRQRLVLANPKYKFQRAFVQT